MRKLSTIALTAAAVAATMTAAVPASAQAWRLQPGVQRQIQADINQLDRRIAAAAERGRISRREATTLRRDALALQRTYNRYSRDGLSRPEVRQLEGQANVLRQRLRLERRDWDGR